MFNIGVGEMVVIVLVLFIVIGPKRLPSFASELAKVVRQVQTQYHEVKQAFIEVRPEIPTNAKKKKN
jgi:sec-independent protein translocase protein TatB